MTKTAEQMVDEMGVKDLLQRLQEMPGKLKPLREREAEERKSAQESEVVVKAAEAAIMTAVQADINPETGKPAYGNDKARDAEVLRRKERVLRTLDGEVLALSAEEAAYKRAYANHQYFQKQLQEAQNDRQTAEDRFAALRSASWLAGAACNLMSGCK